MKNIIGEILDAANSSLVGVAAASSAVAELDPWHQIGNTVDETGEYQFEDDWEGPSAGYGTLHFTRTQHGFVYLIGSVKGLDTSASPIIFVLPEGYRPENVVRPFVSALASVRIRPNGEIRVQDVDPAYATNLTLFFGWSCRFMVAEDTPATP